MSQNKTLSAFSLSPGFAIVCRIVSKVRSLSSEQVFN